MNVPLNTIASAENGSIIAFASSMGSETRSSSTLQNGAFTKALVEAVDIRGDLLPRGVRHVSAAFGLR